MPTYEYACKACGEHLEVVQSFKDEPLKECPSCGGELRKVFSPIGITFKGSGFYKTDSRSVSGPGREKREKSSDSASASSGTGDKGSPKADSPGSSKASSGEGKSSAAAS